MTLNLPSQDSSFHSVTLVVWRCFKNCRYGETPHLETFSRDLEHRAVHLKLHLQQITQRAHESRPFDFHSMAAGKSLWVKLQYRIRPLSALTIVSGPVLGPSRPETFLRTSPTSLAFDTPSLDYNIIPQEFMAMPSDAHVDAHAIAPSSSVPLSNPPMVPLMNAEMLSPRKNKRKAPAVKQRSLSTSHINTQSNGEAGMTLAEKRRNKLGYHRTSIACSELLE